MAAVRWIFFSVLCLFVQANPVQEVTTDPPRVWFDCANVTIVRRSEWHARPSRHINYMTGTPVDFVFIHHTAMDRCNKLAECSAEMRKIQDFHMDNRTWDDIGYSFLIGEDGRAYEGRGWDRIGAHTYGWNSVAVAFSVMGDFTSVLPNTKAITAVQNMIKCGIKHNKITSTYKLYGHRNVRTTECPGQKFYELIETWDHFGPLPPQHP